MSDYYEPYFILWEGGGLESFESEAAANDELKASSARGAWGYISWEINELLDKAFERVGMYVGSDQPVAPETYAYNLKPMGADHPQAPITAEIRQSQLCISAELIVTYNETGETAPLFDLALEDSQVKQVHKLGTCCLPSDAVNKIKTFIEDRTKGGEPERASYWREVPGYPVEDWQYEVANGDTRQGYHDWVDSKQEAEDHEPAN